jgi:uncharacterized membrane protein YphA (DoxX/SURF4 family)
VTCVTFLTVAFLQDNHVLLLLNENVSAMRLPGEILQGILARAALALLRVYLGVVLVAAALHWVPGNHGDELTGYLSGPGLAQSPAFYRPLLVDFVLPNAQLFAAVATWGELILGVLLIIGLMTRLSAAAALLLSVNYVLLRGALPWTPGSIDAAFAAISLALLIGAAGRTFGLDSTLARRWPRSPLW